MRKVAWPYILYIWDRSAIRLIAFENISPVQSCHWLGLILHSKFQLMRPGFSQTILDIEKIKKSGSPQDGDSKRVITVLVQRNRGKYPTLPFFSPNVLVRLLRSPQRQRYLRKDVCICILWTYRYPIKRPWLFGGIASIWYLRPIGKLRKARGFLKLFWWWNLINLTQFPVDTRSPTQKWEQLYIYIILIIKVQMPVLFIYSYYLKGMEISIARKLKNTIKCIF